MGIFVLEAILAIIGTAGLLWLWRGSKGYRWIGAVVTFVMLLGGTWALLGSMYTPVGTSDVAVITSYGKAVGDAGPGIHWLPPWESTTIWDGSVQPISYPRENCLQVKIGNGQSACITLTFTYQVKNPAVDKLFVRYRTQANMQDKLVLRDLDAAINAQLQDYSPITAVQNGSKDPTSMVPFIAPILAQMKTDIGDDITITKQSLVMPYVTFDDATTNRLNAYQTQKVDTLIAQESVATAQQQAKALDTLEQATSKDPNAITQQCITNVMVPLAKQGTSPAGIQCWATGSSGNVVITPKG